MKIVCAWCKKTLKSGDSNQISHGICKKCSREFSADLMGE
jgi:DNA-directed RNA polymerase subunit RPC12/RpoP